MRTMPFVNERISEQDKAAFDFSQIKRPPIYRDSIEPYKWTIDRSRGLFLIGTLGGNEDERNAEHFALWWKGEPVHFKLLHDAVGQFKQHVSSTWHLVKMYLPTNLERDREEILQALREALTEYKVSGCGVHVASHEVHFTF
jgi:hypothetical protein